MVLSHETPARFIASDLIPPRKKAEEDEFEDAARAPGPRSGRLITFGCRNSEVVMTDYATLLRDHVTLKCRSIDRVFLQAYVPKLQTVGYVCKFLRWQRKFKIPSSAAFGKIGDAYVKAVHRFAKEPTVSSSPR